MPNKFLASFFLALILPLQILAVSPIKIKTLVNDFYADEKLWDTLLSSAKNKNGGLRPLPDDDQRYPECPPENYPSSCVEAVCSMLSRFDCDQKDEILEIVRACRNVHGGCVRSICARLSRFDCDQKDEIFQVTEVCRGLFDWSCIDYTCSRLSRFECDQIGEIRQIANQCR